MSEVVGARSLIVPGEASIVLALTALLMIVPLAPPAALVPGAVAVFLLTILAWRRRAPAAMSIGFLFSASLALGLIGLGPQQVVLAIAFAIYALVIRRVPWLHGAAAWCRRGHADRGTVALGIAIVAVSAAALLSWYVVAKPDLTDLVETFVPRWPSWLLVPGVVALALVNAAMEEAAYRGVVLDALETALGRGSLAVLAQAVAFGALHFRGGFPRGVPGVALTAVYGVALGAMRRWSGGLLAPWIVHVLTDVVIFSAMLRIARS